MFVTAVSSISLAVFTNLSIMELDNAKLAQSQNDVPAIINEAPAIQTSATSSNQTGATSSNAPAQASDAGIQDGATASVWAKDEVKRHRERD